MQTTSKTFVLVLWTLAAGFGADRASAGLIPHTYWGAQPGVYSSVTHSANPYNYPNQATIGNVNQFGITDMQVSIAGALMTVRIDTPYQDGTDATHLGDLLISTSGWTPYAGNGCGAAANHFACDNLAAGNQTTHWNFGLGTNGTLYALNGGIKSSDQTFGALNPNAWIYRIHQPVQIDTGVATGIASNSWVSLAHEGAANGGYLVYTVDLAALQQANGGSFTDLGLSWAMTCANSVIQGDVQVPEPGTLALLGLGLLGLGAARRRR